MQFLKALILLPANEHAQQLRPAVEKYFRILARSGGPEIIDRSHLENPEAHAAQRALWP